METGIFIRAMIEGKAESVDIGDPRLSAEQLLLWLADLTDDQVVAAIGKAREAINHA